MVAVRPRSAKRRSACARIGPCVAIAPAHTSASSICACAGGVSQRAARMRGMQQYVDAGRGRTRRSTQAAVTVRTKAASPRRARALKVGRLAWQEVQSTMFVSARSSGLRRVPAAREGSSSSRTAGRMVTGSTWSWSWSWLKSCLCGVHRESAGGGVGLEVYS
ncbi:hypothetical protein B0H21DRAFT_449668 [Amylocystis lapponica]|nr:hypothetical protein B0H21DRAFT_449668 [Amylocystis lapponica]